MAERCNLLLRLKGLGPVFAATLTNEVFYKDFRNHRQVGAYFWLAPSPWQSGGTNRDQGISKAGNPRARRAAVEFAWLLNAFVWSDSSAVFTVAVMIFTVWQQRRAEKLASRLAPAE